MKLHEYLDEYLDGETYDLVILDLKGNMLEESIDYDASVLNVVYKKVAIIKIDQ